MTTRPLTADTIERSVCCHDEQAEGVIVYECSRCGMEFPATDLDGPPYRCPDDHIFLARTEAQQCDQCASEWEGTEWAEVFRCPDCGGTFDEDNVDHVCTPAEVEEATAERKRGMDEDLRRYRAKVYEKMPDTIHTAECLRSLGFTVKVSNGVGPGPGYESLRDDTGDAPWDADFDFSLSPEGGMLLRTDGDSPFRRLVGLVANTVGVGA